MKNANALLLFYVALFTEGATAAVRLGALILLICCLLKAYCLPFRAEILHQHQRRFLQSNTSLDIVQDGLSTTETTAAGATLSELADLVTKHDVLSIPETTSVPTTDNTIGSPLLSSVPPSITSLPPTVFATGAEVDGLGRVTSPPATESIHKTGDPSQVSTLITSSIISSTTGSIAACGNGDTSECSSAVPTTDRKPITLPTTSHLLVNTTSIEPCTPLSSDKAVTEYSIVYTSTITFYGSSSDYTPPYSPITTPNYCSPPGEALITFFSTTRISNSTATLTVLAPSSASPSFDIIMPAPIPVPTFSIDLPEIITQAPDAAGKGGGEVIITMRPFLSFSRHVITFITTDKNPSVVFSPEPTPVFSQTWATDGLGDGDHKTMETIDGSQSNTPIFDTLESVKQSPVPTFHLTAGGDQVIINNKTVSNLKPDQTTTVTVRNEVFTILPTAVVGLGSTITKPAPQETSPPLLTVTTRTLGGVPVIVSGTQVIIDGTTLRIPPQKTTTTINDRRVVLGEGTVAVDRETLLFPSSRPTHEIVTGGEMLTAIGNSLVVLHSTTITYGFDIASNKTIINGETISIGPRGVSLRDTTIGGPLANAKATEYEIVGGITVGKLLPSLIVVNGATYSINQGGNPNNVETTVIDNQTITIGPSGLIISSQTLTYPGSSVTATLSSSRTPIPDFPAETGGQGGPEGDDDSGAFSSRRDLHVGGIMCVCFAMSVWILA